MNEEDVLPLLVAAEERAKISYVQYAKLEAEGHLVLPVLKEKWATARALRELWEDRALEGEPPARGPQRKGM